MAAKIGVTHVILFIVAYLYYRSRDIYLQLLPPMLPPAYWAYGNATTDCKVVMPPSGLEEQFKYCEDMTQWEVIGGSKDNHVLLSCDPGRKAWNVVMGPLLDPAPRGGIWLYSYSGPSHGRLQRLEFDGFPTTHTFHPLGLDIIFNKATGGYTLFVVNHAQYNSTVEVFAVGDPSALKVKATYIKTLSHRGIVSPNAVTAVTPTSFYLTNDHTLTRRLPGPFGTILPFLETGFQWPQGWVDYVEFDDHDLKMSPVIPKIPFPNGMAMSLDGKTAAVASSTQMNLRIYDRNPTTHRLTYRTSVSLPFHPDNLSYDTDGVLYAAGPPFYPSLIRLAKGRTQTAQTWIVSVTSIDVRPAGAGLRPRSINGPFVDIQAPLPAHVRAPISPSYAVESVYQSDGVNGFSTGSTGVFDKKYGLLFASGLYAKGMLQCSVNGSRRRLGDY